QQNNSANPSEGEWEVLFDGTSIDHWRVYNGDSFPDQGWVIRDDALVFEPPQGDDWTSGLDIITKEKYENFHLKLEWQISEGGNSGIFYGVLEQPTQAIYWSALEFQILDNINHPDADQGIDGNRKAASLYDLIPAEPQNTKPHGEWNSVEIIVNGAHVEHWQNGEKVVEFERWTPEWFEMIRNSKFECHNEFGNVRNGHIGLQDHGDVVKYRDIQIKRL
ncbi:MAG: DUF1080 domain-containing protein, partial [Balneolaceae bacterium]